MTRESFLLRRFIPIKYSVRHEKVSKSFLAEIDKMASNVAMVVLAILIATHVVSCHLILGRSLSKRKIFQANSYGEIKMTKLSVRQKRRVAMELLKTELPVNATNRLWELQKIY